MEAFVETIIGILFLIPPVLIITSFLWDFIKVKKIYYILIAIASNVAVNLVHLYAILNLNDGTLNLNVLFMFNSILVCTLIFFLVKIPWSMIFYSLCITFQFIIYVSGIQFWITWDILGSFLELIPYYLIAPIICLVVRREVLPLFRVYRDNNVWLRLAMIPFLSSIALYVALKFPSTRYSNHTFPLAYYIGISLLFAGSLISTVISIQAIHKSIESTLNSARIKQVEKLLSLQKERYSELITSIENSRESRHDMRHQISTMAGLLEYGKFDELREYFNEYAATISEKKVFSSNPALDAIINHYYGIATRENIKTTVQIHLPDTYSIKDSDFSIIVGNCIENAVEACLKVDVEKRFITVLTAIQGSYLVISISNSYNGDIKEDNGLFLSSKRDWKEYGIGLSSVQHIAELYSGIVDTDYDCEKFDVTVMLKY